MHFLVLQLGTDLLYISDFFSTEDIDSNFGEFRKAVDYPY